MPYLALSCLLNTELYEARRAVLSDDDGDGFSEEDGDCIDQDSTISPVADELCNGIDDDCDGATDEAALDVVSGFEDVDGDGFGDGEQPVTACALSVGVVDQAGDCNDADPAAYPGANEVCDDGVDSDCDGQAGSCGLAGVTATSDAQAWIVVPAAMNWALDGAVRHSTIVEHETDGLVALVGLPFGSSSGSDSGRGLVGTVIVDPVVQPGLRRGWVQRPRCGVTL